MLAQKLYTRPIRTIYQCSLLGDERCQTGVGDEGYMIDYDDSKLTAQSHRPKSITAAKWRQVSSPFCQ